MFLRNYASQCTPIEQDELNSVVSQLQQLKDPSWVNSNVVIGRTHVAQAPTQLTQTHTQVGHDNTMLDVNTMSNEIKAKVSTTWSVI